MLNIAGGRARPAGRSTVREINRSIVLNLIREQPLSRADLARRMNVARATVSTLVDDLLREGLVWEGAPVNTSRGRRPTLLHIRTHDRYAIAVDVRFSYTQITLADLEARQLALETFPTLLEPTALVTELVQRIQRILRTNDVGKCEGVSIIVPGMVDRRRGVVLNSPQLGWKDVRLRDSVAAATGLPVLIENAPIACALGQWSLSSGEPGLDNFAYVAVGDGVGVGLVADGEVVRGYGDTAGEFGHLPLDVNGERCLCGLRGCWEAYTSNLATLARYFKLEMSDADTPRRIRESGFSITDLIAVAQAGNATAVMSLKETARYLGLGLANIITAFSPSRIYVGGEITAAWSLIGHTVEAAARSRALTDVARSTPIIAGTAPEVARLRGATQLLLARSLGLTDAQRKLA